MTGWLLLWTAFLAVALLAFAVLGVVVTVHGFADVLAMLRQLAAEESE